MWGLAPQTEHAPDLTVPLPHTEHPPDQAFPTYATRVTTLKNGLRVASADHNLPAATVGIHLHTGSAYEQISGTTHLLKHMAFKQSANYSQVSAFRALESMGAMPAVTPGRESCVYQLDTVREAVPHAVALLADTVLATKFLPWEIDEAKLLVKKELDDAKKNHQGLVQELTNTAAYGGASPLGAPLFVPPRNLPHLDGDVLSRFVLDEYLPSRMVLTCVGADHDDLVALAETHFGSLEGGAPQKEVAAAYEGGEVRESSEDDLCHVGIAFKGCSWNSKDLVPVCVLNTLMGGGASFSAGGPGKGMYTRLYQNVLNRSVVQAASVYSSFYNGCGTFGIYGATSAHEMGALVDSLCGEMKKMATSLGDEEVGRAKNQLKSSLLMNLESRPLLFEDIGRQVISSGAYTPPLDLVAQIEAVTAPQLLEVAKRIVSSAPSVVVVGDTTCVPRYDVVAKKCA